MRKSRTSSLGAKAYYGIAEQLKSKSSLVKREVIAWSGGTKLGFKFRIDFGDNQVEYWKILHQKDRFVVQLGCF